MTADGYAAASEPNPGVDGARGGWGLVVEAAESRPSPRGLDDETPATRPHEMGRRIARFRETDRTVSGDASHAFGRRIARDGESTDVDLGTQFPDIVTTDRDHLEAGDDATSRAEEEGRAAPAFSGRRAPLVSICSVPYFQVWFGVEYRISGYGFTVFPGMVWGQTTVFPGMVYRISGYGSKSQVA